MAEKSLAEIKADILQWAGRINPFERVRKTDAEQIVDKITSLDPDLWGREWGEFGAQYEKLGDQQEKQGERKAAGENFYLAYEYYRVGRYPVPSSSPKAGLDQPCAPLLCINGQLDDQHPISDLYLLAEHGSPKDLRIIAGAGHMGRVKGQSNHEVVRIVTQWLKEKLA